MDTLALLESILGQLELKPPASEEAIGRLLDYVKSTCASTLPEDYLLFLRQSNGCVGIGPNLSVILEPAEEVPATTDGYGAPEFAPGMIVIGGDGCGNIIGIDVRSSDPSKMTYCWADPVCFSWTEIAYRGAPFAQLLSYLDEYYSD